MYLFLLALSLSQNSNAVSPHPNPPHRPVVPHHDRREQRLPEVAGPRARLGDGGGAGEVEGDDVGLHPPLEVADLVVGVEGPRGAYGGEPPEVGGVEGVAAQLGDLVGGGHGAEHGEAGAAAGVGGEADAEGGGEGHVEEAGANEGVRGGAVGEGGAGLGQPRLLARGQVDGVAVEGAVAEEALCLIRVEVVAGLGVEVADPGDLVRLL